MFIDRVEIELQAGNGGDGCASFRREKFVPKGGPDGGDGGNGGSIILKAQVGVNSLAMFANRKFFKAERGRNGEGSKRFGRAGKDMVLLVPCGTSVIDSQDGFVVKDLATPGEEFMIARGGKGGLGNVRFKSSTNQTPRDRTMGVTGEFRHVILELKSIADVGLIGKPNAGKSTLLSRISSARPEIADFPFTTKYPNLGIVDVDDDRSFITADIPGLIEGASEGVGLGHEFLRHIERAGLLVHLVEPTPTDNTDPVANYAAIRDELNQYDESLLKRDEMVVLTKCELDPDGEVFGQLESHFAENPVDHPRELLKVSAATEIGLKDLVEAIMEHVIARRLQMIEAGEEVTPIRLVDTPQENERAKRIPTHKRGVTAGFSNERQAKHVKAALSNTDTKDSIRGTDLPPEDGSDR